MRDANSQRVNIMIRVSGLQQAPGPHVSHAEIGVRNSFDARACDCIAANEASDSKEHESRIHADWAEIFYRMVDRRWRSLAADAAAKTYDGQRCALLTTKSRKTWTRATVFNSSG
jgi:hypothetical protein